ncbi:Demethylspheroidene O-methyltransferase [Roseibium album]|nr:Demethylspheroidene O-methyltransferase [Roseibium album]
MEFAYDEEFARLVDCRAIISSHVGPRLVGTMGWSGLLLSNFLGLRVEAATVNEGFAMTDGDVGARGSASTSARPPEDTFLGSFLGAIAINAALKTGVITTLAQTDGLSLSSLNLPPHSARILVAMLVDAGVCECHDKQASGEPKVALTSAFTKVYRERRTTLEQKLAFLLLASRDLLDGFPALLSDLPAFMRRSETFSLFRYDKAIDKTEENIAHTRLWVDYVTALSEAESGKLITAIDLTNCRRLLEIGGNTGAFAHGLLKEYPALEAVIMDLPVVCDLGEAYAADLPERSRLQFLPGDARRDTWPNIAGQVPDVVLFKSVLHDWPPPDTALMLDRAKDALAPGGRIVICERGPLADEMPLELGEDEQQNLLPFTMAANIVFSPFYRPASFYVSALAERGFEDIKVREAQVEMTFNIVSGRKPKIADSGQMP